MSRIFLPILLMIKLQYCWAQNIPPFKSLRYEEKYDLLVNDTSESWYKKMKYTSISSAKYAYVSLGGDIRFQYFWFKNEDWGEAPEDKDGNVLTR